jgi:hypothetical protein
MIALPHRPGEEGPDEFEPNDLPVEPDEGPIPTPIPDDPGGAKAPLSIAVLALPHERDESHDATALAPDPVITQAKHDIDAGMVDTDMRATPGLDAELRTGLVPGPGGQGAAEGSLRPGAVSAPAFRAGPRRSARPAHRRPVAGAVPRAAAGGRR